MGNAKYPNIGDEQIPVDFFINGRGGHPAFGHIPYTWFENDTLPKTIKATENRLRVIKYRSNLGQKNTPILSPKALFHQSGIKSASKPRHAVGHAAEAVVDMEEQCSSTDTTECRGCHHIWLAHQVNGTLLHSSHRTPVHSLHTPLNSHWRPNSPCPTRTLPTRNKDREDESECGISTRECGGR